MRGWTPVGQEFPTVLVALLFQLAGISLQSVEEGLDEGERIH